MTILEIAKLSNGSHRSQEGKFDVIPDGWAVVPDGMKLKNLPFGEVTAQKIDGVMTVTEWIAGQNPQSFPETETI